ncbi:MAG: hybrid sensor histidine kinase/response regulator, partial [Nostocales cyanobacterium]
MSNYTLLELFRQEVATNIATLKQCLPVLKTQPHSQNEIEQAIQAAHSLWGITSIMEIEKAANLVQLMKNCFIAVQQQNMNLREEEIDTLLHASDLLLSMSKAAEGNLDTWITDHAWGWNTTQKIITNLIDREQVTDDAPFTPSISPTPPTPPTPPAPPTPIELPEISNDGDSMMDLFRLEAQAQVNILNNGLLIIENKPQSAQELEALMRAAHSIKGSARIVGLDGVVELAHVMEDCFVAAQAKTVTLTPDDVDVLLQGVDLLQSISQINDAELPGWLGQHQGNFRNICDDVAAILQPGRRKQRINTAVETNPQIVNTQSPVPSSQSLIPSTQSQLATRGGENTVSNQDRVVRVSADNLNRIMGLAGESLIEANWLQPFADSMMSLKSRMLDIARNLEQLEESIEQNVYEQEGKVYLLQARQQKQECIDYIGDRLNELELYVRRTASLSDRLYREVINSHMRPFEDGLQSFPRMIRDLARNLNKQVKLEIIGKSTPVDRDILQKLEAPLTHILRNAVDHGLELPEERIAVGKSPEGTIRLEAFHRGGMLAITISDDGKGIDREQLRQKIINKNLVTTDMAAQLSDAELMEFLFLPGFSTAKQV